jgi:hypothetical protein
VPTTCTKINQIDLRPCDLLEILPEGQKGNDLRFFWARFGHTLGTISNMPIMTFGQILFEDKNLNLKLLICEQGIYIS